MLSLQNFDITYVKGIGPQKAKILGSELNMHTAYDLLHHYPTAYIDRSTTHTVREIRRQPGANTPSFSCAAVREL